MCGRNTAYFGLPTPTITETDCDDTEVPFQPPPTPVMIEDRIASLNTEQRAVFDCIEMHIREQKSEIFFLDAPGGTGKTYLFNTIVQHLSSQGKGVVAVASSGIASTLIQGATTAHSAFSIPLDLRRDDRERLCTLQQKMKEQLRSCSLILWDEAPMINRAALEIVDRTLKDHLGNTRPMGGILTLFAGDFRQILPVVPRGTQADILDACIKNSYLWSGVTTLRLTVNMRLQRDESQFSDFLLNVGNGEIIEDATGFVKLPEEVCFSGNIEQFFSDFQHSENHALLATTNRAVNHLNSLLLDKVPGEAVQHLAIDSVENEDDATRFPTEFLNSLTPSGLPLYCLNLKVGCPVMVIRNIDPPFLVNGTICEVLEIRANVIRLKVKNGPHKGYDAFLPRIGLYSRESESPVIFKRLQFPVRSCMSMTINKSQGQTFEKVFVHLEEPVFTHGMLYVALSRVTSKENLKVYCRGKTKNIVFRSILQ